MLLKELYATNLRLRALIRQKTRGAILRSRARWQEQGEHNTKYFLNLEKRNHCRKNVTKLKINDHNESTSNQFEILNEERKFYKTLYKSQNLKFLAKRESSTKHFTNHKGLQPSRILMKPFLRLKTSPL